MSVIIINWFVRIMSLSWLTGPIFDMELRVSSRRRRNYVLRFAYIVFFMALAALVWIPAVPRGSTSLYQASRMGQAGLAIVAFVVWFQFIASQVIAIVMLSTAISDEIYNKTLGLLMTTPVGSFQIVLGKLLSKLLQLLLLMAITLPLLAVVRVFGGVPWGFLVCGLSVSLTTAVFLGTLSLFFSIFTRRAHTVIITSVLTAGVLFLLIPMLSFSVFDEVAPRAVITRSLSYVNPYFVLFEATGAALSARGASAANWPAYCWVALSSSALLLLPATIFVRKVALRQATGQEIFGSGRRKLKQRDGVSIQVRLRRVVGPCVFWKESRTPLLGRLSVARILVGLVVLGLLLLTYALCAWENTLDNEETHVLYAVIFVSLGILVTTVLPATCITSEKESRAWPILLTTTVSNWDILAGKFLGALRRCSVAWALLFAHVIVFVLVGFIHPVAIVQLGIMVAWIVIFLCGTGLYFSARFRRTTTAVIANVVLAAGLWALLPLLLASISAVARAESDFLALYLDTNPFVHAVVITAATAQKGGLANYDWIQGGIRDLGSAMGWIVVNFVIYVGVGLVFLWRAWARLRRHPV